MAPPVCVVSRLWLPVSHSVELPCGLPRFRVAAAKGDAVLDAHPILALAGQEAAWVRAFGLPCARRFGGQIRRPRSIVICLIVHDLLHEAASASAIQFRPDLRQLPRQLLVAAGAPACSPARCTLPGGMASPILTARRIRRRPGTSNLARPVVISSCPGQPGRERAHHYAGSDEKGGEQQEPAVRRLLAQIDSAARPRILECGEPQRE